MTLQATETLQNGPFQAIFNSSGNFVGFLNPRANGLDLRIGGDQPGPATFTTLTVSGTATAASFVGPLTGNASTATTLATARNINGVAFNGSADITVTAAASTLTGTTLAASVVSASLNSITPTGGTLAVTGSISATDYANIGQAARIQGTNTPGTGAGLELFYNSGGTVGGVQAYDRTGGAFHALILQGSTISISPDGSARLLVSTSGATVTGLTTTDTLRVNVTPTAETPTATHTAVFNINGTNYKFLCLAA